MLYASLQIYFSVLLDTNFCIHEHTVSWCKTKTNIHNIMHNICITSYIYICWWLLFLLSVLILRKFMPKCRAWGGHWAYIYIYIYQFANHSYSRNHIITSPTFGYTRVTTGSPKTHSFWSHPLPWQSALGIFLDGSGFCMGVQNWSGGIHGQHGCSWYQT